MHSWYVGSLISKYSRPFGPTPRKGEGHRAGRRSGNLVLTSQCFGTWTERAICTHWDRIYSVLQDFQPCFASRNHTNVFVNKHVVRLAISKHNFLEPVMMLPSTFLSLSHLEGSSVLHIKWLSHSFPPNTERAGVRFWPMVSCMVRTSEAGFGGQMSVWVWKWHTLFSSLEVGEMVLWVKYFPCKHKDLQPSPRTQIKS